MSDIFDKIGQTFSDIGESVSEKSKYVAEAAKLNAKILQEKSLIGSNYSEIGRFYAEHYSENPDPGISDKVAAVIRSKELITEMESKILALKGYIKCAACGANVPFDDKFCGKCGAILDKPAPPPAEEEEILPNVSVVPDDVPDDIVE
ncbi:MAG: zinc ribbon domain-containing protein [Ruminococcus sp.]|jgi:hypothetical protein|nr:zinc ribbon domain-containing protein [Ruminococcus sp.]